MNVIEILNSYLDDIRNVVDLMRKEGINKNPSQSWQKTLCKSGEIKEFKLKYNFHGMGCWVKWNEKIIDFDFRGDPENGIFGIDLWFCAYYLQSLKKEGLAELNDCRSIIRNELEKLEKEEKVVKHDSVYFFIQDYNKII